MSLAGMFRLVESIQVQSGAGQGYKALSFEALRLVRKMRDQVATESGDRGLWMRSERRANRRIDALIEIYGMERRNAMRAALKIPDQETKKETQPEQFFFIPEIRTYNQGRV